MSILDPKALQEAITSEVGTVAVKKPIEFILNGKEFKGFVYVKSLSYEAVDEVDSAYKWIPLEDEPGMMKLESVDSHHLCAAQILGTICTDEQGTPYFESIEQVEGYPATAIKAFWTVANEVNIFSGKLLTMNSENTNSGQNSSSTESVDEASQKPDDTSATKNTSFGKNTAVDEDH